MHNFNLKQKGVSLIELMIAMALGIIIIFGATRALSSMLISSRVQISNSDMQQTADIALSYIGYRLRNALSTPCDQLSVLNQKGRLNINTLKGGLGGETITNDDEATIKKLLEGHGIAVKSEDRTIAGQTLSSDELTIASANERILISGDTGLENPVVKLASSFADSRSGSQTLFAITNCESMDIFRGELKNNEIKPMNDASGNQTVFRENYRSLESTMVSRVDVAKIKVSSDGSLMDNAVFKNSGGSLMTDIELLRVIFAVDSKGNDGIADKYISAKELDELSTNHKVISAEIFLIVKDGNPDKTAVPDSYLLKIPKTNLESDNFKGDIYSDDNVDTLTFTDNIRRKLFVRTVTFRNSATL